MCGVNAIFAYGAAAPAVDRAELLRTRDAMSLRGPDAAGLWIADDGAVGLGHRRLAIIDLSDGGVQPMAHADGALRIVFNGEIYNYLELRRMLERRGHRFRSQSDTEVLLHLYELYGTEMVHHLRGMYAFALWDERRHGMFLARDPFGIKPLYYADDGGTLRVASQVKALLAGGGIRRTPSAAGRVGFLLWGHVPEPHTMFREIKALPAGSSMWVDEHGARAPRAFFSVGETLAAADPNVTALANPDYLRAALSDAVEHHLIADVPVGIFLSAGIDSGSILRLAAGSHRDLRTLTLGFAEFRGTPDDEVPPAEALAARLGTIHSTRRVGPEDFAGHLDAFLAAMDQPTIDGVNVYFVSKAAAESGLKVALSGLGGDEIFGGYPSFRQIPPIVRCLSPLGASAGVDALGRAVRCVSAPLMAHFTSPKYAGVVEYGRSYGDAYLLRRSLYMPWELGGVCDPEIAREGWDELRPRARLSHSIAGVPGARAKVTALELDWYMRNQLLRDADWAGMAHSLEIRVPFIDVDLFRRLAPLIVSERPPSKRELAGAAGGRSDDAALQRGKTGFVVPFRDWLAPQAGGTAERGLRGWARHVIDRYDRAAA